MRVGYHLPAQTRRGTQLRWVLTPTATEPCYTYIMANKPKHNYTISDSDVKGRLPKGAQYNALKGMCYRPSDRDTNRKGRKQAKQNIRRGEY